MHEHIIDELNKQPVGKAVLSALTDLLKYDSYLLSHDVNERSITHRLASYLQTYLPEWHVDCEYNRNAELPKRLLLTDFSPNVADTQGQTVFPDIIAHIRGSNENYLVIEVKKSTSHIDRAIDKLKLEAYKNNLGYQNALFIELGTNDKALVSVAEWV